MLFWYESDVILVTWNPNNKLSNSFNKEVFVWFMKSLYMSLQIEFFGEFFATLFTIQFMNQFHEHKYFQIATPS